MTTTKVYGESDDLIEFRGDLHDEFGAYGDDPIRLTFSDDTVLDVFYGERGIWKITPVVFGSLLDHIETCDDEDAEPHSDIAHFKAGLAWVRKGEFDPYGRDDDDVENIYVLNIRTHEWGLCRACGGHGKEIQPKPTPAPKETR